jgi:hypothetical protein
VGLRVANGMSVEEAKAKENELKRLKNPLF